MLEAQQLLQDRQLLPAASILRDIDDSKLSATERTQVVLIETELHYLAGDTALALATLQRGLLLPEPEDPGLQQLLARWQLRLLLATQGPLAAAASADGMLLSSEDEGWRQQLEVFIWDNLQRTPQDQLDAARRVSSSQNWRGWLELALVAAQVMDSPDVQIAELDFWRQRHPQHSANSNLPGGLGVLGSSATSLPTRIALLLPLGGGQQERGRALLEGYLAAQFEARQRGWPEQELMVMDSSEFEDINAAYATAVSAGAELVIGPMAPEDLLLWQPRAEQTVPLMTLTWLPQPTVPEPIPVQLGLASVDEARQLARIAYARGARKALLIRPQGEWGQRMSDALVQQWTDLEGEIQAIASFSGQADYSSELKAALNLADSESRARRINQLMAESAEFSPRRRKDLDIVFLLSETPQDARSIKPLIAFHYAADLPVYSTSHIFSGRRDAQRDRDLNGIRLLEIPWLLDPTGRLQTALAKGGGLDLQSRMHALGADAFMLNWRLQQFAEAPGNRIRGNTGLLNMDAMGRVHRELVPAQIRSGVPQAL
ncbi:MAG: penicillin-binding protein activator [Halieaceae bacterium]